MSSGNSQHSRRGRLLVAADDALVRGTLVDVLSELGFEIVGAAA